MENLLEEQWGFLWKVRLKTSEGEPYYGKVIKYMALKED